MTPELFMQFKMEETQQEIQRFFAKLCLGGGNSNIFYFHPDPWGWNDPIWRAYFSDGWFNHQPANGFIFVGRPKSGWFFTCHTLVANALPVFATRLGGSWPGCRCSTRCRLYAETWSLNSTLPETYSKFAPENGWFEDDSFLFGIVYFQGLC